MVTPNLLAAGEEALGSVVLFVMKESLTKLWGSTMTALEMMSF